MVRSRSGALRVVEGQTDVFARLIQAGMHIEVCETVEDVLYVLKRLNVPVRRFT